MSRINIVVSDDLTARYPAAWPVRMKVRYEDGTVASGESNYPRGNPENPVSTAELEEKFTGLIVPRIGESAAAKALEAVRAIEASTDVSQLLAGLPLAS